MRKTIIFSAVIIFSCVSLSYGAESKAVKYFKFAEKLQKQGQMDNAVDFYNEAIKLDNKMWQAWFGLGTCYYEKKKYHNAKLVFKYVLILKPGEPSAEKYLGLIEPQETGGNKFATEKIEKKSKGDLLWRSAVFPGFGQFYNGDTARGYLYSIAFLASAGMAVKMTIDQQKAVDDYTNTNTDFDKKYKEARDATTMVFIPLGAMAAVWIAGMIDSFVSGSDAPGSPFKKALNSLEFRDSVLAVKLYENRF